MKFDELNASLRIFETVDDRFVLPGVHIIALRPQVIRGDNI